jgi:predicted nuclease with RNAse H fold
MLFTDSTFIGVDLSPSHKSFAYAALDKNLNLIALEDGEMEEVTAFLSGQQRATVAINAPAGVNRGLASEKAKRELLTPRKIRGAELRLAEFELRQRGISVAGTPSTVGLCAAWIQLGFNLYRKLEKAGFKKFPQEESASHQFLETHPHACFSVMAGSVPLLASSLEGKLQRQLLLYERGVRIKDPMDFFEEITRHKIMKGILPLDLLYQPERLNALAAAYTSWLAVHKPGQIVFIGDTREGQIVLPVAELKEKY